MDEVAIDDVMGSWSIATLDGVTHEYGHWVQYQVLYEGSPWTGCSVPHVISYEFTGSSAKQCAMQEGFADAFPSFVYNRDSTIYGLHLEPDGSMGAGVENNPHLGSSVSLKGEMIEINVAMVLWDIRDTSSSSDATPGTDDDGLSGKFNELWYVLENAEPSDIFLFWDAYQMYYGFQTDAHDDELATIYLKNNVARFRMAYYAGESEDNSGTYNLEISEVEVLSMNTLLMFSNAHKVLFRFTLHNEGTNAILFSSTRGIFAGCRWNVDSNNCDFGHTYKGGTLSAGSYFNFVQERYVNSGEIDWSFWPCYQLNDDQGQYCTYRWHALTIYSHSWILYDNFEGTFTWTASDRDTTNPQGLDYWGKSTKRPYQGSYSAWCAAVGTRSNPDNYDDFMDAYMYKDLDLRFIYVKFLFNVWYEQENTWDYWTVWMGNTGFSYYGSAAYWQAMTKDNSEFGTQSLSNIRIELDFYSDVNQNYRGVFIDNFMISYEE